jgi:hypothetical protein
MVAPTGVDPTSSVDENVGVEWCSVCVALHDMHTMTGSRIKVLLQVLSSSIDAIVENDKCAQPMSR